MKTRYIAALALVSGFGLGAVSVQTLHAQAKPPAYTIAEIEVKNPAEYQKYIDGTGLAVPAAGGRFLVRGGRTFVINGSPPKRIALIEWPSFEKGRAYHESEAYRKFIPIRDSSSDFRGFVIEGMAR